MDIVIYSLCALTSLACAIMLLRGYLQSRARLLFWSTLCFVGLTTSNVLLVIDRFVLPEVDLYTPRLAAALVGFLLIVFGLAWEKD